MKIELQQSDEECVKYATLIGLRVCAWTIAGFDPFLDKKYTLDELTADNENHYAHIYWRMMNKTPDDKL